jgi:hypothetical protein
MLSTYPYSRCDDCNTLTHIHELARIEGPYREFGEQGTIYLCWKCYMDRQDEDIAAEVIGDE